MRIGTLVDLQRAIGFERGVQEDILGSAVDAGTQILTSLLGTELEQATVIDRFYILPTGSLPVGRNWRTRLALSRGFVQGAVTILYGGDLTLTTIAVPGTNVAVDNEKGAVAITGPDLRGQYVTATYLAGFTTDGDDQLAGVPSWMREAATMAAMAALDHNAPDARHKDPKAAMASAVSLNNQLAARIASKARFFPGSTHPIV